MSEVAHGSDKSHYVLSTGDVSKYVVFRMAGKSDIADVWLGNCVEKTYTPGWNPGWHTVLR